MADDSNVQQLMRLTADELLEAWHAFFADPFLSLPALKAKALAGQVPPVLRSLRWRYQFSLLPPPAAPVATTAGSYGILLSRFRSEYTELRERFLKSPDGGWVNDGAEEGGRTLSIDGAGGEGSNKSQQTARQKMESVQVNNPLSLDSGNPWQEWFADLELRKTIRQDVQRTFPDVDYFRASDVQDKMTNLLFIYCKLNPDLSYRQGLHELLAPFLWLVDYDSLPPSSSASPDSLPHLVLSRTYVEHDTWSLFSDLMNSAKSLYDFSPSVPLPIDRASTSTTSFTLNSSTNGLGASSPAATVLVQPIVSKAIRIHDTLLRTIDHSLWAKLEHLKIEPQLYTLRWLRLLYSREFPIADSLRVWDGLFAEDTSLRLMEYFCVAMLLRVRDAILASDYSGVLQLLLRYPSPPDGDNRISLLLRQAIFLRDNVSATAGELCRQQNAQNSANAGIASGEEEWPPRASVAAGGRRLGPGHRKSASVNPAAGSTAVAALLAEGGGLMGDLAKGVYGRAEALGINKALFSTFNDIKRNVNQVQQAQGRDGPSDFPNRPPWERSQTPVRDYLSEIARLRASNAAMGRAVALCVDVLERGPSQSSGPNDDAVVNPIEPSVESILALTALKHVRDVLSGQASSYDSNVLSPLVDIVEKFAPPAPPSPDVSGSKSPRGLHPPHTPSPFVPSPMARTASASSAYSTGPSSSAATTPPLLRPHPPSSQPTSSGPTIHTAHSPRATISPPLPVTPAERPLPSRPHTPTVEPSKSPSLAPAKPLAGPASFTPSVGLSRVPLLSASSSPSTTSRPLAIPPSSTPRPVVVNPTFPPTSFSTRPPTRVNNNLGERVSEPVVDPLGVAA